MKFKRIWLGFGAVLSASVLAWAADSTPGHAGQKETAIKPYPLKTCLVSGEKLGGDMGTSYVFTNQNQEIKLCCKACLKKFKQDQAGYLKKLDQGKKN